MADAARTLRSPASWEATAAPEHGAAASTGGVLPLSPRPTPRAAFATKALPHPLAGPSDRGHGGRRLRRERKLRLGSDALVPDLVGQRRSRPPAVPDGPGVAPPPNRMCEALAPATRAPDRTERRRLHARAGVPHPWRTDQDGRGPEAFLRDGGFRRPVATPKEDEGARLAPFGTLPRSRLWPG